MGLTSEEIGCLNNLKSRGYNWLARDPDGRLYAYTAKPQRSGRGCWLGLYSISVSASFKVIRLNAAEPTSISKLLEPESLDILRDRGWGLHVRIAIETVYDLETRAWIATIFTTTKRIQTEKSLTISELADLARLAQVLSEEHRYGKD